MASLTTRYLSTLSRNVLTRSSIPTASRTVLSVVPRNALRSGVWNAMGHRSFSASAIVKAGSGASMSCPQSMFVA